MVKAMKHAVLLAFLGACAHASTSPGTARSPDPAPNEPSIVVGPQMGSPHVGDAAPAFDLVDQSGAEVSSASLRGAIVMLAFVTSWCPFSRAEQPWLAKLADDYRGKGVKVIAIDIKEDDAGYRTYLGRVAMPLPVLRDRAGDVTLAFTPPALQPSIADRSRVLVTSNVVLDRNGTIRFFTAADTVHFDAELVFARRAIDTLLAAGKDT
jgi:thiol-disulfide isomerase/thioredoxin